MSSNNIATCGQALSQCMQATSYTWHGVAECHVGFVVQLLEYAEDGDAREGHKQDYFIELWDVGARSAPHVLLLWHRRPHSSCPAGGDHGRRCDAAASQGLTTGTGPCAACSTSRSTASSSCTS